MRNGAYLFLEGIKNLWKNRTMSIASIIVLSSCLLLTGIAVLLTMHMETVLKDVESNNYITVYLTEETPKLTAIKIGEDIRKIENIYLCEYIAGEDAIEGVMQSIGDNGTLFDGFGSILPDAYRISLTDLSLYDDTMQQITAIPEVDSYTDYSYIAGLLNDFDQLVRYASIGIILVLSILALFIIANTLKVTMFSRRVEISIMKSVGATNLFVRVPFLVEGSLIGAISGGIAATIVFYSYKKITEIMSDMLPFITKFDIDTYAHIIFIACVALGIIFGLMGGIISIGRYLKKEGEKVNS